MRISRFSTILFAALCCLLLSSQAQAQHTYGYASIVFDRTTNTVTGYASTELDYDTAAYYDAQVQAQIQDDSGNVYASGSGTGSQTASIFLDVINALLCIRFTIISYVIVGPRFDLLGCGGRYDPFGFSDFPFDTFWDFGDFFNNQERCIFNRLIFIASIIASVIECLPTRVQCGLSSTHILPSGLNRKELSFIPGANPNGGGDQMTVTCNVIDEFGNPQSGQLVHFGFTDFVLDSGGHENHIRARPRGSFSRTQARSDANGVASSVFTAPEFGGTTHIVMTATGSNDEESADIYAEVPGLEALPPPVGNAGYILTGSSEGGNTYHPNGHYGTPQANASMQAIAADYRDKFFPADQFPDGVPLDRALKFNDQSLKFGGKFDITPNFRVGQPPSWRTDGSHDEHKVGINADISDSNVRNDTVFVGGIQQNRWQVMERIFCDHGSSRTNREHCRGHWHLRFEFGQECTKTQGCKKGALGESRPARGGPAAVPGRIEAERYDADDEAAGSFVPDDGNGPTDGIYYNYPQVLPVPGDEANSYVPTIGGQWMNYTVNIASSGSYTFTARVASAYSGNTFHVEVDGVDKTGPIAIPYTGSGDVYQFASVDNISLDVGQHMMTVVVDGWIQGAGNFDYFTISPYTPPNVCQPTTSEINLCRRGGGYWDYDLCDCVYGNQF